MRDSIVRLKLKSRSPGCAAVCHLNSQQPRQDYQAEQCVALPGPTPEHGKASQSTGEERWCDSDYPFRHTVQGEFCHR